MSDCNCYKIEGNSGDNTVTCMYMYDIYIYAQDFRYSKIFKLILIPFEFTEKYYSALFPGNQILVMVLEIIFINHKFSLQRQ